MTNPDNGENAGRAVPEVLEGLGHLSAEIDELDEQAAPADLLRMVHRLAADVERNAEYGRQLWHQLGAVVTYLREDVVHAATADVLGTEDARRRWADVYSSTLSLLAGPRGDSGYGEQQAQLELQNLTTNHETERRSWQQA